MIFLTSFILLNEIIENSKRSLYSSLIYVSFSIGGIFYSLLFMKLNEWRGTFLFVGLSAGCFVLIYWFFALESPRYLLSKGLIEEYILCIEEIAVKNGKMIDDKTLRNSVVSILSHNEIQPISNNSNYKKIERIEKENNKKEEKQDSNIIIYNI